ncbi:hypothetical protein Bca4012_098591 [Brassica carinata]|uniref:Uncharacterized protein n=1 Tax=Brassica carinata TaxID=52824 RepID=A0A8X7TR38_BRACI|nr:hypothetical protein Bca52824_081268 [Brassica carinata]
MNLLEFFVEEGESADADTASCYYDWLLLLRGIHVVTTTQEISESKDQRSLKKIVQTFMKDDGGEQYLRLPTTVVVVVTAKTYHKMFFFCRQQTDSYRLCFKFN